MTYPAKHLPYVRLYNAVVYTISATVFLTILFVLEAVSPGERVFRPGSSHRATFMTLTAFSWALCGIGSLVILCLYYPCKRKAAPHFPHVNGVTLSAFVFALFVIAVGLGIAATAAVFVFFGSRERNLIIPSVANDTFRTVVLPILTGIVPAVFFAFMGLSVAKSFFIALSDFGAANKVEASSPTEVVDDENPFPGDDDSQLTREQERQVNALHDLGFTDRASNIEALQYTDFDVRAAESRLHQLAATQPAYRT
jgi:hypothetical protein